MMKKEQLDDSKTKSIEDFPDSASYNVFVGEQLQEAYRVNNELHKKIKHLEGLLMAVVDSNKGDATKLIITPEEIIADLQIQRLVEISQVRSMTLDEVRQYDLLVKNKRLAMSQPTTIEADVSKVEKITDVKLLAEIASLKIEENK